MIPGYAPHPEPLDHVSPTTANTLLMCPLRVAFQRDPSLRQLAARPQPDAALGSASHALAEAASRGEFDHLPRPSLDERLSSYWDSYVDRARTQFERVGVLGPVPPPARWPFYAIKRARAVQYATRIVGARRPGKWSAMPSGAHVELDLQSDDPPLIGRIDRVELGPDGVCLVDLKTGTPPDDRALAPAHKNQLLLYAALYKAATGRLPQQLAIQYRDGDRRTITINWDDVERLVVQILGLREEFNSMIAAGSPADWEHLARAEPKVCLHCEYQAVCGPFFSEIASRQPSFAACAIGQVDAIDDDGGTVRIRLLQETAPEGPTESTSLWILGIPSTRVPAQGDRISVCWATRMGNSIDLRVTWQSNLYVWSPP